MHCAHMNLGHYRELAKLTQGELGDLIGADQATISRAENMHGSAKLSTYRACAKVLGVTLADIFSDVQRSDLEMMLLRTFRSLPENRQQRWLQLLDLAMQDAQSAAAVESGQSPGHS